jgi:hypothetical protein
MRRTAFRSLLVSVLVCTAACGAGPASAATLELKVVEPWRLVERGLSPGPLSGLVARLSYRSDGDGVDRVVVALTWSTARQWPSSCVRQQRRL